MAEQLKTRLWLPVLATACAMALAGCGSDSDPVEEDVVTPSEPTGLVAFAADGQVKADITWTDYGVPYITADNLESLGYGVGFAFARDNICILADQVVKFNSERARYFGPDRVPGSGDSDNILNDFGYLALGIRDNAEQGFSQISERAQALITGYAAGYNRYLADTGVDNIAPECAGQPWVKPITPIDVMTYAQGVALLPGAANFTGPLFLANPPQQNSGATNKETGETMSVNTIAAMHSDIPDTNPTESGSNGWALGSDMSASGQGMLIANPHFPHTGNQRFWQFGIEIPDELKVVGGSLSGMPGIINIGFNENVAWTHTFSTASRFTVHRLTLDENDAEGKTYLLDGESVPMTRKFHEIEVATGPNSFMTLQRSSYHSEFGPVIVIPNALPWGTDPVTGQQVAYALHDANLPNYDLFDHWLGMNLADSIESYKQTFVDYTGTVFNNAMAVDKDGNAFFTDGSSVPNIVPEALAAWSQNALYQGLSQQAGLFIFPGDDSLYLPQGTVPFAQAPQLERSDFVQNSNNSYWLTNPATPITGVSPLWGPVGDQQSFRSRLGQKMLAEGGSVDGKFTRADLVDRLIGNRTWLAEEVLDDLVAQCQAQGSTPVMTAGGSSVDISSGCAALAQFDGRMNLGSVGAMMFREFATEFSRDPQWQVAFDPAQPVTTPNTLAANNRVLQQLATAQERIESANLSVAATLSDVQFVERSLPDGTPSGVRLPWGGANNIEGGFNVFRANNGKDGTLLPRHIYPTLPGSDLSAVAGGYPITYGSSWMFAMEFTAQGPVAEGLLTYSQASNSDSDHYLDQTLLYSSAPQLRPLHFNNDDVASVAAEQITLTEE
ncbi:Acyl-homoserine lactone acylase PvdQ [Pseudidiomarina piscicola]|uniref:Acyl-homoserine lactone acylase PvdQ n=1 Tax=Pseudidiomarina piscicola TaxID=2614830 RepID=A0A6S6WLP1_9GAMM|nr:acylase [Pseudidiomarina piscicola]CAB0151717.1 Acyl-homoserine lactone acylase PvdQ [Pseudidiomarina piscicola]VZT41174.1 Acyl-homoserine lactone acylase PvdQ [Pseudomonas aeruginosa]